MDIHQLLDQLWVQYRDRNPQVLAIHELLASRGERIVNDHIALRTFDDPRVNIAVVARPFVEQGYQPIGEYVFEEKKLQAQHFEHEDENLPRVFISELELAKQSGGCRSIIAKLLDQVDPGLAAQAQWPAVGRPWHVTYADYQTLQASSEYAAWMAAWGFCANHFTVDVNQLRTFASLEELNAFLKANGFTLNSSGGEIKGSPRELLEQSSTLADKVAVDFAGETHEVPCCYYEFARRYPDERDRLFSGFIAKSADRIFESTDKGQAE